jgi:hypothetical protein
MNIPLYEAVATNNIMTEITKMLKDYSVRAGEDMWQMVLFE